ncbi:MAG: hypothetical protein Q9201_000060 [Fulgogasparrea decipioides]
MSLGKFTASAVSGTQETTVALAALNFDFALFKTEAPQEYKALGSALSPHRREIAEDGDIHTTARKLRAMFEQILPATPSLYSAYGVRASEIASISLKDQKLRGGPGPFAVHQGVNGGSIWAAATSGAGAVAIHLLACMLAKLWSPSEATSIWEEIVLRRKEQLAAVSGSDPHEIFAAWAAKSSLTRQQLANWDASARAWLRAGDDANRVRQRQLKLIIENINIPVNTKSNVYDSVISAWTSAMIVMNKLIEGMPHSIENGSILLALSAWHLFPDMSVLSTASHFVKQGDPLIDPQGILTLGLQTAHSEFSAPQKELEVTGTGITWSLPLACYRFYGDPVRKDKALNTDGSRISIDQLLQVALGCIFHGWRESGFNATKAAELLWDLWKHCTEKGISTVKYLHPSDRSWLGVLADAAKNFLAAESATQKEYTRLFNYGRRRCPQFLGMTERFPSPVVALQQPQILLNLAVSLEGKLRFLRKKAITLGFDPQELIIRYALPADIHGERACAIATVIPIQDNASESGSSHKRWVMNKSAAAGSSGSVGEDEANGEVFETLDKADILEHSPNCPNGGILFWSNAPTEFSARKIVTSPVDEVFGRSAGTVLCRGNCVQRKPRIITGVPFECILGNPAGAAIFRIILGDERPTGKTLSAEDIRTVLAQPSMEISQNSLIRHLGHTKQTMDSRSYELKVLCTIVNLCRHLGDVTIAMTLTSRSLYRVKWMAKTFLQQDSRLAPLHVAIIEVFEPLELDLASSFACIAMLESGTINIASTGLQSVMAMSSGDSLYIATSLLSDPACRWDSKITRIRGNIGRAGIALLIPREKPRVRDVDPTDWNLINHDEFDGVITDSFKSTSLHMSFTEFVLPIDTGLRGTRDTEIYFLETVISVHD